MWQKYDTIKEQHNGMFLMARRSAWEGEKPAVIRMFEQGVSISEIRRSLGIPRQTLVDWYRAWEKASPKFTNRLPSVSTERGAKLVNSVTEFVTELGTERAGIIEIAVTELGTPPPSKTNLVLLPQADDLSDFGLARWALRGVIRRPNQPGAAIIVRAAQSLARLVTLKAELPKHVLEETEEITLENERRKLLEEMTPAEIAKEYRKILDGL